MEQFVRADAILTENGYEYGKSIQIKDGLIKDVRDACSFRGHGEAIDFSGCIISPCFCDYHLHFFETTPEHLKTISHTLISYGITNVVEGGDRRLAGFNAKQVLKAMIDIEIAGFAVYICDQSEIVCLGIDVGFHMHRHDPLPVHLTGIVDILFTQTQPTVRGKIEDTRFALKRIGLISRGIYIGAQVHRFLPFSIDHITIKQVGSPETSRHI